MKKIIILSLALLMGVTTIMAAESISSNSFNIMSGETKTFSISLTNERTDYVSFQMDLTLPANLRLNKASCSLSSRFSSGELTIGKQGENTYRLTATSFSLTPISGKSGNLITLSVTGQNGFTGATATIKDIIFVTTNSQRVTMADASFNITRPAATVTTAPTAKTLTYTGTAQLLVNAGVASGGTMQYSLDNKTYSTNIPTGTNAGTYTVYYKVVGDANHTDKASATVSVTIKKAASAVTTAPTAKTLTYTGSAQLLVNAGVASGGTMQYSLDNKTYSTNIPTGTNAGTYTVYYKVVGDANHTDKASATVSVTIKKAASAVTTAPTAKTLTYTGAAQLLVNAGVASGGTMQYSLDNKTYSTNIPTGTNAGTYTVYYKVVGDANHTDKAPATVSVTIKKAASAVITAPTAKTLIYTGSAQLLVSAGEAYEGTMQYSLDNKTYSTDIPTGTNAGSYIVYYKVVGDANHADTTPAIVSVTIKKAACAVISAPTAKTLTYTGKPQQLVNAGEASGGTMQYSLNGSSYSTNIPTGTDAGTYTVYYKVVGDANHTDTAPATVSVTIEKSGGKKGDVNVDGSVDVADIASIIDVMAQGTNDAMADVNGDGSVDVADIASVIDIMAANARRLKMMIE